MYAIDFTRVDSWPTWIHQQTSAGLPFPNAKKHPRRARDGNGEARCSFRVQKPFELCAGGAAQERDCAARTAEGTCRTRNVDALSTRANARGIAAIRIVPNEAIGFEQVIE
jgi:hypothetical protein